MLKVKVVRCDKAHDYALLESAVPVQHFLRVGPVPTDKLFHECYLLTWDIALSQEREIAPGFAVHRALISRQTGHHISYDSSTFDGDCGGALILKHDFTVVGMHQGTVNRARELKRLQVTKGRLDDIEDSVESLIRGLNSGAVALRLDAFQFT
ncbi:hypothetical protein BASA81_004772 [Batrachochytrium salamandrivorans]|nr:hypothetical protein BASA81_004772 [Batrachochytrium salamandrivorans]